MSKKELFKADHFQNDEWKEGGMLLIKEKICGHEFELGDIVEIIKINKTPSFTTYLCKREDGVKWYVAKNEAGLINTYLKNLDK